MQRADCILALAVPGSSLVASEAGATASRRRCPARASGVVFCHRAFGSLDGARNVAQRNLARIVAGLAARRPRPDLGRERPRRRANRGPRPLQEGHGRDRRRPLRRGIEELKKAYEILPHPNVLYNIARAYADQGDLENAVAYYKQVPRGEPEGPRRGRADCRRARGAHPQAAGELLESQQVAGPRRRHPDAAGARAAPGRARRGPRRGRPGTGPGPGTRRRRGPGPPGAGRRSAGRGPPRGRR